MNYEDASLESVKALVRSCLTELYNPKKDRILFSKNKKKGIAERCLVFRFAHYLQMSINNFHPNNNDFFVDCDYNASFELYTDPKTGERKTRPLSGKKPDKAVNKKRFIDIIVHKRTDNRPDDFLCFEIKKWNNYPKSNRAKDFKNLKNLTMTGEGNFQYKYGFFILLGKDLATTQWVIFERGQIIPPGYEVCVQNRIETVE